MPTGSGEPMKLPAMVTSLGGVRAHFVANLGRRLSELQQHWSALEHQPSAARARDEVRRRVHALATRARLLDFVVMANRLDEAESRLDRSASSGALDADEIAWFQDMFQSLSTLAWNDVGAEPEHIPVAQYDTKATTTLSSAPPVQSGFPLAVLVVGREHLSSALVALGNTVGGSGPIETERTEDVSAALDIARALAPDLIIVDVDLAGGQQFVKDLGADPLTEPVPVVVVGSWSHPDEVANLIPFGIARAVAKPVSPDQLRQAAEQALALGQRQPPQLEPMGELTIEQIADRLAAQFRSGLLEAANPESMSQKVQLGEGTELLGAVWGAVARVRETLVIRSQGRMRFSSAGPAGAVPVASWLETSGSDSMDRRDGDHDSDAPPRLRLDGRKALVVDDDPAVTWFLSGLLRSAGAFVYEAHSGRKALEIAFRVTPDLVITDVIMPELDGFGLCREIKRDVALRDVPVILLSWKEDLLQRVRELGANADGYLKKESSTPAILRRVREVLRPRLRVEARLRGGGEVKGRLDGMSARTLLFLACATQPDCRVTVRDANFLYEVAVRGGSPRAATRTENSGPFIKGSAVLVSLLGTSAGRFQVVPDTSEVQTDLQGDLNEQLISPTARIRAAQQLLGAARLSDVVRVHLSLPVLLPHAMPEPVRSVLQEIHDGVCPQDLILSRKAPATLVETVLSDAAVHGAVEAVLGQDGEDLLEPETRRQIETMTQPERLGLSSRPVRRPTRKNSSQQASPHNHDGSATGLGEPADEYGGDFLSLDSAGPSNQQQEASDDNADSALGAPTSLTEAVIREVLDPEGRKLPSHRAPPPMLDARELRPRSLRIEPPVMASLPPDAVVPGLEAPPAGVVIGPEPRIPADLVPLAVPHPRDEPDAPHNSDDAHESAEDGLPIESMPWPDLHEQKPAGVPGVEEPFSSDESDESDDYDDIPDWPTSDQEDPPPPRKQFLLVPFLIGLVSAIGVGAGVIWWLRHEPEPVDIPFEPTVLRTAPPPTSSSASLASPPAAVPASAPPTSSHQETNLGGILRIDDDLALPTGMRSPPAVGLVEVSVPAPGARVDVDGQIIATATLVRSFASPGEHQIVVHWKEARVVRTVSVRLGRRTRLTLVAP